MILYFLFFFLASTRKYWFLLFIFPCLLFFFFFISLLVLFTRFMLRLVKCRRLSGGLSILGFCSSTTWQLRGKGLPSYIDTKGFLWAFISPNEKFNTIYVIVYIVINFKCCGYTTVHQIWDPGDRSNYVLLIRPSISTPKPAYLVPWHINTSNIYRIL